MSTILIDNCDTTLSICQRNIIIKAVQYMSCWNILILYVLILCKVTDIKDAYIISHHVCGDYYICMRPENTCFKSIIRCTHAYSCLYTYWNKLPKSIDFLLLLGLTLRKGSFVWGLTNNSVRTPDVCSIA